MQDPDVQSIPTLFVPYFYEETLPPIPPHVADAMGSIYTSLRRSGALIRGRGWGVFEDDPSDGEGQPAFERVMSVFESVVAAVEEVTGVRHTLELKNNSTTVPYSMRAESSLPDGYMHFVNKMSVNDISTNHQEKPQHSWDNIAVAVEYKEPAHNGKKILRCLHHALKTSTRRSVFGITIESTAERWDSRYQCTTRLWFARRGVTVGSEPFNFATEIDLVVHLIYLLAFSEDHQLGWDPTVRLDDKNCAAYDTGPSQHSSLSVYRTARLTCDFRAEAFKGRATGIFESLKRSDNPLINEDLEGINKVYKQILTNLENRGQADKEKLMTKYFLPVHKAEAVKIYRETEHNSRPTPDALPWHELLPDDDLAGKIASWTLRLVLSAPSSHKDKTQRGAHYRLLLEELPRPMYDVMVLADTVQIVRDVLEGLGEMHKAGWAHGDVSLSNALHFGDHGKVADFELPYRVDGK